MLGLLGFLWDLHSGKRDIQKTMERSTMLHGKTHEFYVKCSIVMSVTNYQRVSENWSWKDLMVFFTFPLAFFWLSPISAGSPIFAARSRGEFASPWNGRCSPLHFSADIDPQEERAFLNGKHSWVSSTKNGWRKGHNWPVKNRSKKNIALSSWTCWIRHKWRTSQNGGHEAASTMRCFLNSKKGKVAQ